MTADERFARIRIAITLLATLAIGALLGWQALHGGVPAHHVLHRADMPAISNWWGALVIPALTWFLLGRTKPRATTRPKLVLFSFAAGALVGAAQAITFFTGHEGIHLEHRALPLRGGALRTRSTARSAYWASSSR